MKRVFAAVAAILITCVIVIVSVVINIKRKVTGKQSTFYGVFKDITSVWEDAFKN